MVAVYSLVPHSAHPIEPLGLTFQRTSWKVPEDAHNREGDRDPATQQTDSVRATVWD